MTEDAGTVGAGAEKQLSKRGSAFTRAEDIIVAKAFIAASKNAICGAHQKGRVFKAHMFEFYKDMTADSSKTNKALLEQFFSCNTRGVRKKGNRKCISSSFPRVNLQPIQAADFGRGHEVHGY
jgi:hypothetical protein